MVRFLSDAWLDELNAAVRGREPRQGEEAADGALVLQQVVTGGPDGDRRYWVRVERGSVVFGGGEADAPHATFTQDYETAAALNRGELSAEDAFLAGRVRVGGDVSVLLSHRSVLTGLEDVFAGVRTRTTY
jgi:putative sterol carrier protein